MIPRPFAAFRRPTVRIHHFARSLARPLPFAFLAAAVLVVPASAQDRLKTMPGYAQHEKIRTVLPAVQAGITAGAINASWAEDGRTFEYDQAGRRWRYDVRARKATDIGEAAGPRGFGGRGGRGGGGGPARGRQFDSADSPDGLHKAFYRDRNLWISRTDGSEQRAVTTDGSEEKRIKYGTASWVYGEELGQTTAMWWSPDGTKLAYYRFDESKVPDYYLELDQTKLQSSVDVEAYPKSGVTNPSVELFVHDLASGRTTRIDVRDGKPLADDVVGYYVYNVAWTPDGSEITFNRTNRRQNVMEFTACTPSSGACRVVVHEEWPTGWVDNRPTQQFLADGKRFIWASERTGFENYYLYDLTGKLLVTLTSHPFEVAGIERVDEKANTLWYMARDGDNYLKVQLHRVGLDGKGERRLTDPALNHNVTLSPDGRYFVDVAQTHDSAPVSTLMDAQGKKVADLATGDLSKFDEAGFRKAEMFTYLAADGKTTLRGMITFPSDFDPSRKYPVLVPVYGGPASASNTPRETFVAPNATAEYGFLIVNLESRAAPGMGKRMLDAIYEKLGQSEIDDMAEGVKALRSRAYVDGARVGIYGTSYGGYSSVMSLLRYPDVYAAASASSPVTDWRHYDTIYTERYMYTPQDNKAGYDAGSAMTYVNNLKGRLMLYYGTADNNVHPNNMMQLIDALQRAGKSFDVQVGPDRGHSGINPDRMMEFFIENLVMKPSVNTTF
jgi:dipeptidyl-peptidase 4